MVQRYLSETKDTQFRREDINIYIYIIYTYLFIIEMFIEH